MVVSVSLHAITNHAPKRIFHTITNKHLEWKPELVVFVRNLDWFKLVSETEFVCFGWLQCGGHHVDNPVL